MGKPCPWLKIRVANGENLKYICYVELDIVLEGVNIGNKML